MLTPEIPSDIAGDGSAAGRFVLTIQEAEFHVEPVDSGEPLRVEAPGAPGLNLPTLRFSVSTGMGWLESSDLVNRERTPDNRGVSPTNRE